MLGFALLATMVAGPPVALPEPWVGPEESVGHVVGFQVRVDLHGAEPDRALLSAETIRQQVAATLRSRGIAVVGSDPEVPAPVHAGALILDVHVLATDHGTALAWTLHASQNAQVLSGAWTFASTWEVGDLLFVASGTALDRLRSNLQPALDDFCQAYLSSRAVADRPKGAPPVDPSLRGLAAPPGLAGSGRRWDAW